MHIIPLLHFLSFWYFLVLLFIYKWRFFIYLLTYSIITVHLFSLFIFWFVPHRDARGVHLLNLQLKRRPFEYSVFILARFSVTAKMPICARIFQKFPVGESLLNGIIQCVGVNCSHRNYLSSLDRHLQFHMLLLNLSFIYVSGASALITK